MVETYRELAQNPSIVDAEILNDSCNLDFVKILSKWNQRNIERGEIIKFQKHHMIKWSSQHVVFESVPVDITQE